MNGLDEERFWRAKVAAWVHDPAEKALVLLRDPAGHEGGTAKQLLKLLFPEGLAQDLKDIVKEADHWSAAADRPQFPRSEGDHRYASWARVDFATNPQLVHPLSGEQVTPSELKVEVEHIKAVSFDHLESHIQRDAKGIDFRKTFLSLWRFGQEHPARGLGALWSMLPADTRVPDHAIWEHLKLCSAYAGAAASGGAALLLVSLGPVQGFISQARSTSDLWAGSHLLSTLAWEAMRVVAERCGPDSILFPDLHGVPIVDLWLANQGVDFSWMSKDQLPSWMRLASDANPLFTAALPNRFLALVPESEADKLALAVRDSVRSFAKACATHAWQEVLDEAAMKDGEGLAQIARQLDGFPEVAWTVVPASLALDDAALDKALRHFYPVSDEAPGFLGTPAYQSLRGEISIEGAKFYRPGPGTLYSALHDLAERGHAAAKSSRPFAQLQQHGFRCSLCGEREWLTTDRALLDHHAKQEQPASPWQKVSEVRPAWVKEGERLCARCCVKRLWPKLFMNKLEVELEPVRGLLAGPLVDGEFYRYVVSTHMMAMAPTFRGMVEGRAKLDETKLAGLRAHLPAESHTALPRSLYELARGGDLLSIIRRLPAALDDAREADDEGEGYEQLRSRFKAVSGVKPETYYGLILLDGDRMGQWLSGDAKGIPSNQSCFHSAIRAGVRERIGSSKPLDEYMTARRAATPAFHGAISRALNGFSLHVARSVVEDVFLGKLIYAGGDDLLAMVAVQDLLPVLLSLRCAYSGLRLRVDASDDAELDPMRDVARKVSGQLRMRNGYVLLEKQRRLFRMMGPKATLSAGAVVAHHMSPLGAVLRQVREAERAAKGIGGRDAFCISLVKRSGGITNLVSKWGLSGEDGVLSTSPGGVLMRTRHALAHWLSRRAAYHLIDWLAGMPTQEGQDVSSYEKMLKVSIHKVFRRQLESEKPAVGAALETLATDLACLAVRHRELRAVHDERGAPGFLQDILTTAEFLAREQRGANPERSDQR